MARVILPWIRAQFFDDDGAPLAGGYVAFYEAGTTNYQDVYESYGATEAQSNPVALDSAGTASIWIDGTYDIAVYDGVNADPSNGDYGTLLYTRENIS